MKRLLLILTFCALFAGTTANYAEAQQGANVQFIHHRYNGGFQFGFNGNGFYFGIAPGYGYRNYGGGWNYGYRNYGGGWNYGYRNYGRGWNCGYRGCGNFNNYYYGPRAYNYQFAPQYFHPYRGGRHWRY
jgi:hypothetical protein